MRCLCAEAAPPPCWPCWSEVRVSDAAPIEADPIKGSTASSEAHCGAAVPDTGLHQSMQSDITLLAKLSKIIPWISWEGGEMQEANVFVMACLSRRS